jgi:hypothetical protein
LPSTSGNGPKDVRRKKPEEAAVELEITLVEMEQLLDVVIANYNCEPHSSLHGRSPLEYLRHYIAGGGHIPQIPEGKRSTLGLLDRRIKRTVRGSIKAGKRPHITFAGVTYHNEVLARSPDLIGKDINIIVRLRDARSVHAFFPDGNDLGVLVAQGHWGVSPHDYRTRRAITKLRNKGLLKYFEGSDPIKVYMEYLEAKSKKHKSARLPLAKIRRHKKNASPAPKASDGIPTVEAPASQNESATPKAAASTTAMPAPRKTVVY